MLATLDDHRDAAEIAQEAGARLLDLRAEWAARGEAGRALGAEGDRHSQRVIAALLAERHPDDAVLSEESADDGARLGARRVWIIDPLDGTREFGEPERWDWSVHVALAVDGSPAAAAVALPARDLVLSTAEPPRPAAAASGGPRLVVSRTRPPEFAAGLAAALGAELVPMGSAGAKAMAVVLGEADAYVHAGGQFEWDSAAPAGVAVSAGLHVSRLDGNPPRYNQPDPAMPDLVVSRPELAPALFEALRALGIGGAGA